MLGYLIFAVAFFGSLSAAYQDIRTTEVSDIFSFMMASIGILLYGSKIFSSGVLVYEKYLYFGLSLLIIIFEIILASKEFGNLSEDFLSERMASITFGLVVIVTLYLLSRAYLLGTLEIILRPLASGIALLGLGWFLYLLGAWGGADALILGSLGFVIPNIPSSFSPIFEAAWPFPLTLLMNVFIVGSVYIFFYSAYEGLRDSEVMRKFRSDLKGYWKRILHILGIYVVFSGIAMFYAVKSLNAPFKWSFYLLLAYLPLLIGLLILYRFLNFVQNVGMVETKRVEELEPGDVLSEGYKLEGRSEGEKGLAGCFIGGLRQLFSSVHARLSEGSFVHDLLSRIDSSLESFEEKVGYPTIVGLTEDEIEKLREERSEVKIVHGVRFVPTFPVAVLVSFTVGDIVFALFSLF
ncbi:MAG: hypothetical protein MUP58_02090 [Candidatus Nanohaloarchaeota archaeon QJJ-9]|nr:hypothetical protein [Candidatus Nanohaloarchaeota archaeon QJJ-9]